MLDDQKDAFEEMSFPRNKLPSKNIERLFQMNKQLQWMKPGADTMPARKLNKGVICKKLPARVIIKNIGDGGDKLTNFKTIFRVVRIARRHVERVKDI